MSRVDVYGDGMTIQECAVALGCSNATVWNLERRALEKLRKAGGVWILIGLANELERRRFAGNKLNLPKRGRGPGARWGIDTPELDDAAAGVTHEQ